MILAYGAGFLIVAIVGYTFARNLIKSVRMEQELRTASFVQKILFPKNDPVLPQIHFASFIEPAMETGGDWYGYLEDAKGRRLVILMGDVTGHGVPAALVTSATYSAFKTLEILRQNIDDPFSPRHLLSVLNKIIYELTGANLAMTFVAASFDLKTRVLTYANAGHEPPIIYRRHVSNGSGHFQFLNVTGPRLGERPDEVFKEASVPLDAGDLLLFYTDGLVECDNGHEEFGSKRLTKLIERAWALPANHIRDALSREARDFYGQAPRKDDVAFIVAKVSDGFVVEKPRS